MRLLWLALFALLLSFGCAGRDDASQNGAAQGGFGALLPAQSPAAAPGAAGNFLVPQSAVNYTAHYTLNENGAESYKTVWRAGRMMRISLGGAVDLFFLSDRAYTCSSGVKGPQCFDISGAVGKGAAEGLFSAPDLSSAQAAEEVDIGGLAGKCYLMPSAPFETHKMCFTPDMLLAYDEYNGTAGKRTTEYLTELDYSVSPSDFALPAQPAVPPQN